MEIMHKYWLNNSRTWRRRRSRPIGRQRVLATRPRASESWTEVVSSEGAETRCGGARIGRASVLGLFCLSLTGCASRQGGKQEDDIELTRKETSMEAEGCQVNAKGAQKLDANGDGRPEVVRVMVKGREVCRIADLNLDGKVDRTSYFSESSELRRVESDFDRDGRIDEIALFSNGIPTEKRSAVTMDGRIDTWDYFTGGKLTRTERDQNGDGVVDQWWEYPRQGCPLVHMDRDGDGRPDPGASIDYCKATGETVGPVTPPSPVLPPTVEPVKSEPVDTSGAPPDASAGAAPSQPEPSPTKGGSEDRP